MTTLRLPDRSASFESSDMNLLSTASDVPLHCNICPKQPDFSDISHLLTHIASKAHLSHEYKVKVRATQDPHAKDMLDAYQVWYEKHNLGDLMHERMQQKEKRGRAARRGASGVSNASTSLARKPSTVASSSRRTSITLRESVLDQSQYRRRDSFVDPDLGIPIKKEPFSRPGTPVSDFYNPMAFVPATRYFPSLGQSWSGSPFTQLSTQATESANTPSDESWEPEPRPKRRSARGTRRRQKEESLPSDEVTDEFKEESAKLKGVKWPGMTLFDAAPPEMRRKRNQKKSTSVVEHLRATSEQIVPQEKIYDSVFSHKRTRPITGSPDIEDDPLPGESTPEPDDLPPPRKRSRRARTSRQPLAQRNTNNGRLVRRNRTTSTESTHGPYYGGPNDDDLSFGASAARYGKRKGLSIHIDNSGPAITFSDNKPSGMNALLAQGLDFSAFQEHRRDNGNTIFHQPQLHANTSLYSPSAFTQSQPDMGIHGHCNFNSNLPFQPTFGTHGFRPSFQMNSFQVQDQSRFGHLSANTWSPASYSAPSTQLAGGMNFGHVNNQSGSQLPCVQMHRQVNCSTELPGINPIGVPNGSHQETMHNGHVAPQFHGQDLHQFDAFGADLVADFGQQVATGAVSINDFQMPKPVDPIDLTQPNEELFVSSNKSGLEDDQVTISAPGSDYEN